MKYIFEKSMLTELANNGCNKQVINRLDVEWKKFCKREKIDNGSVPSDLIYIEEKLTTIPYPDRPPLAKIKLEGELAEIRKLEELSHNYIIISEFNTEENDDSEEEINTSFLKENYNELYNLTIEAFEFSKDTVATLSDLIKDEIISSGDFKVKLSSSSPDLVNKFIKRFNPSVTNFIYQPEFSVDSDFFYPLVRDKTKLLQLSNLALAFKSLRPDLVQVFNPDHECSVLDKDFNIVESNPRKIKLQICDIKMSEFTNKFFLELGLYIVAFNSFIYKHGLDETFEVVAAGKIYPQDNTKTQKERLNAINSKDHEFWLGDFANVKGKLENIFNFQLFEVISIIEERNIEKYSNIKVNHKCQTCDYYGGQYSDHLKGYLKRILHRDVDNQDVEAYLSDPSNNFCRYVEQQKNSVNLLSSLKNGEKNLIIDKRVNTVSKLESEIQSDTLRMFKENKTLKADKKIIETQVKLKMNNEGYSKTGNSTLNLPKYSDLTIFIDERHDTQGRSLSFSLAYRYKGKDPKGVNVSESTLTDPYIAIIEDFSVMNEKRYFLDFLIHFNNTLKKFEDYKSNYNNPAKFSIIYWSEENVEQFKRLFLSVFKFITNYKDESIDEVYAGLPSHIIIEKRKEISQLLHRFNSFFTSDEQLQDYRVVEKNPFFSLKKGVEDLYILNINFNNTLIRVLNLLTGSNKREIFYKPDSDQFNGAVYSQVWKNWRDLADKSRYIDRVKSVIKDRIIGMNSILMSLYNDSVELLGSTPEIPMPAKINLYPELKFGTELVMLNKLNAIFSMLEKESIHNDDPHPKTVLGKSVYLEIEITGDDRKTILEKYEILNLNSYRVYRLNEDAIDSKIDENGFALTLYPINKKEFIYTKFTTDEAFRDYCIYYNPEKYLQGIKFFKGKGNGTKTYMEAVGVNIVKFDRFERIVVLDLSNEVAQIIDFLEKEYAFDYSQHLLIEATHVDYWEKRLKQALERIKDKNQAKFILESYIHRTVNSVTSQDVESSLQAYYNNNPVPLDDSQKSAIVNTTNSLLTLLWGPPGTGKSHTIAHLLLYLYLTKANLTKVLVMGNYDPTDNILSSVIQLLNQYEDVSITRIKSSRRANANFPKIQKLKYKEFDANDKDGTKELVQMKNKFQIFSSTPEQVEKVFVNNSARSFAFDFVIVDEASQMDVGHFIPGLIKISPSTQFLLAGDHLQLPPVSKVKIKGAEDNYYGSIYDFFRNEYADKYPAMKSDLLYNRRSNKTIVDFSKLAFNYPSAYQAVSTNANGKISFKLPISQGDVLDAALNPNFPTVLLSYNDGYSHQSNTFEAERVLGLVSRAWEKQLIEFGNAQVYSVSDFFDKGIGIVVPHRAQKTVIQQLLMEYFITSNSHGFDQATKDLLKEKIISSVDTVEKYQGQQREIMICSYVLGDPDIISQEEEFIFNPNRLNVIISRARFKVILLASEQLLSHASDNIDVIDNQKSLLKYVDYTNKELDISADPVWSKKSARFRYRD